MRILLNFSPSEVISKSLMPKSIPIELSLFGKYSYSVSNNIEAYYLPYGSCEIVTELISPTISRLYTIFYIPTLGSLNLFP